MKRRRGQSIAKVGQVPTQIVPIVIRLIVLMGDYDNNSRGEIEDY